MQTEIGNRMLTIEDDKLLIEPENIMIDVNVLKNDLDITPSKYVSNVHKDYVNPTEGKINNKITHVLFSKVNETWVNGLPWEKVPTNKLYDLLNEHGDNEIIFQFKSVDDQYVDSDKKKFDKRINSILKKLGYSVSEWNEIYKNNGISYFKIAKKESVMNDFIMPEIDGWTLHYELKYGSVPTWWYTTDEYKTTFINKFGDDHETYVEIRKILGPKKSILMDTISTKSKEELINFIQNFQSDFELPDFKGSEKQNKWAKDIYLKFNFPKELKKFTDDDFKAIKFISKIDLSKFWIENRFNDINVLMNAIKKYGLDLENGNYALLIDGDIKILSYDELEKLNNPDVKIEWIGTSGEIAAAKEIKEKLLDILTDKKELKDARTDEDFDEEIYTKFMNKLKTSGDSKWFSTMKNLDLEPMDFIDLDEDDIEMLEID